MDLKAGFEDLEWLRALARQLGADLHAMEKQAVCHTLSLNDVAIHEPPPAPTGPKPMTITEYQKSLTPPINYSAVAGPCFDDVESLQLWELQYIGLFALYVSPNLRAAVAMQSPSVVAASYFPVYKYIYEQHVSGASLSQEKTKHGESVCLVPKSALHFTVHEMLRIYTLYNTP